MAGNLEPDPPTTAHPQPFDYWETLPALSAPLKNQHSIYIDATRSQLWVCDNGYSPFRVRGVQIAPGGGLITPLVLDYPAAATHDAMPVGDRLFTSGAGVFNVFKLPTVLGSTPSTMVSTGLVGHSAYFDSTGGPGASWFLSEQAGSPAFPSVVNFQRYSYSLGVGAAPDSVAYQATTYRITPVGFASPNSDVVHHIRGSGRTGFLPNYNDGISLASLVPSGSGAQPVILGSFDTSWRSRVVGGTFPQAELNRFDGTWDMFPGNPSGVVYASGGDLGALAFRVAKGQINRYWKATPFPAGSAAAGLYPVVVSPYGPPRANAPFSLEDASATGYPYKDAAGNPVTYRHTLYYSSVDPVSPSLSWTPSVVTITAQTNSGELNLDPLQLLPPYTLAIGKWSFYFPSLGDGNQTPMWFAQVVVEEIVSGVPTGRWAASRGTWIGVAP